MTPDENDENFNKPDTEVTFDKLMSLPMAFQQRHHQTEIKNLKELNAQAWRPKDRMKTVSVALTMCLNVGVDPPDIIKTSPCARKECWIDPAAQQQSKALELISQELQTQYERWQPRARYRTSLDPTSDDIRRLCNSLRRNAKEERVLFHYNGHGVPKPTTNGEIWVFNQNYTQYIPLSVYDLQAWMQSPSIYVYDCSCAGQILKSYNQIADGRVQDLQSKGLDPTPGKEIRNCIQLAACSDNQLLPMNAELPADLFTACLTTPIRTALQWFYWQNLEIIKQGVTLQQIEKIPGKLADRKTPLGELNWIFTAITDTIAWNVLPRALFHRLFRQDLMVASLFRNFLLAERIMRSYKCTPVSEPKLPPTFMHRMWAAWDNAVDDCLCQLPQLLSNPGYKYKNSEFFSQQLTSFQVWLSLGLESRESPTQLPIVLQVLLSQVHRLKALDLLSCFLDLGPWAVNLALSVGIFPYVLKLLQSLSKELRPMLVFIWAKILAVDNTCQMDVVKDGGHQYFLRALQDSTQSIETRARAAFVLAEIVKDNRCGQEACSSANIIPICLTALEAKRDPTSAPESEPLLQQWVAICLGRMWSNYDEARWRAVRDNAHERLYALLDSKYPQVRTATVYALGKFVKPQPDKMDHVAHVNQAIGAKLAPMHQHEASSMVRAELVNSLQSLVSCYDSSFVELAVRYRDTSKYNHDIPSVSGASAAVASAYSLPDHVDLSPGVGAEQGSAAWSHSSIDNMVAADEEFNPTPCMRRLRRVSVSSGMSYNAILANIWKTLDNLKNDPHPAVAALAKIVTDNVKEKAKDLDLRSLSPNLPLTPSTLRSSGMSHTSPSPSPSAPQQLDGYSNVVPRHRRVSGASSHEGGAARGAADQQQHANNGSNRPPRTLSTNLEANEKMAVSEFCEWSSSAFAQPSCLVDENGVLVSQNDSHKREMRRSKVEEHLKVLQSIDSNFHRLDLPRSAEQQFFHKLSNPSVCVRFHPDTGNLISADKAGRISTWDWINGSKKNEFRNNDYLDGYDNNTHISDMLFVNQHTADAMLIVANDDGALRVWSDDICNKNSTPRLVTAWRTVTEEIALSERKVGTIMKWNEKDMQLFTAGDSRYIGVWDVEIERQMLQIFTSTRVSSISFNPHKQFAAGCDNGTVQLYDFRIKPTLQSSLLAHQDKIIKVAYVEHDLLLTASTSGSIKLWDVRKAAYDPYSSIRSSNKSQLVCVDVHPQMLVIACATSDNTINLLDYNGEELAAVKSYDGFLGKNLTHVNCMSYHPLQANLAVGTADCNLSVHSGASRR